MRVSAIALGKRTLKYGGKSGILPPVRPVFKGNPIFPKTEAEIEADAQIEQGYADGVPLPRKVKVERKPSEKAVFSVEERIKQHIDAQVPKVDVSTLSEEEQWHYKKQQMRREYLREAYEKEAERLLRLREMKIAQAKREKQRAQETTYKETEATRLTLPTIDLYLQGPMMRRRTPEEVALVREQREFNRRTNELAVLEKKASKVLELYHAAGNYITTEEELENAVHEAFEVKVGAFESSERLIEDKLFGYSSSYASLKTNEKLIKDQAFGEINGQPGLDTVKETLSGEAEAYRREAQARLNNV